MNDIRLVNSGLLFNGLVEVLDKLVSVAGTCELEFGEDVLSVLVGSDEDEVGLVSTSNCITILNLDLSILHAVNEIPSSLLIMCIGLVSFRNLLNSFEGILISTKEV